MKIAQNKAVIVAEGSTGVKFEDVAGADEAKEELVGGFEFVANFDDGLPRFGLIGVEVLSV